MSMSELIQPTKHRAPPRIVIHGPEKVGKSTFFSQRPDTVFLQTEDGLSGIDAQAFPLCTSFDPVLEYLGYLANEEHSFTGVVLDSGDWLERLIFQKVMTDDNAQSMEAACGGYGKAYGVASGYFKTVLDWLNYLRNVRGMTVGIICHSVVVPFNDPVNEPYDRYELQLHQPKKGGGTRDMLLQWADVIGFADKPVLVTQRADKTKAPVQGKEVKVARGISNPGTNQLYLNRNPAYAAGNRYGLPDQVDLNWPAFQAAFDNTRGA